MWCGLVSCGIFLNGEEANMPKYTMVLIIRGELEADQQITALRMALAKLPHYVIEVHIKEVKEIAEVQEEDNAPNGL